MKWMIALTAFALILSGVFSQAVAGHEPGHGEVDGKAAEHHDAAAGHGHSIGVKQPEANVALATRPGKVTLVEPKALAKVSGAVTLKWTPAEHADVYHVQVAKDPRFKWFVVNEQNVSGDSFQTPALEPGPYFWRVAGRKPSNDPTWTKGFFTTSSFEVK